MRSLAAAILSAVLSCTAAMAGVVTGLISTRTPRGRSSQYGSAGMSVARPCPVAFRSVSVRTVLPGGMR